MTDNPILTTQRQPPISLAAPALLEDNRLMTDLSFSIPDELAGPLKLRINDCGYGNAGEYLRDLVRRDLEEAADTAWVRAKVEEGLASGIVDRDPTEIIEDIIAKRRAQRA